MLGVRRILEVEGTVFGEGGDTHGFPVRHIRGGLHHINLPGFSMQFHPQLAFTATLDALDLTSDIARLDRLDPSGLKELEGGFCRLELAETALAGYGCKVLLPIEEVENGFLGVVEGKGRPLGNNALKNNGLRRYLLFEVAQLVDPLKTFEEQVLRR